MWTSRQQRVSLDACVTEAFARSGNAINHDPRRRAGVRPFPTRAARSVVCLAINHDPRRRRCNVKRCRAPPGELRYNDVMYDVTSRVTSCMT